jgi:transcriptional regulator with GAF, ATPase, and Fis domain
LIGQFSLLNSQDRDAKVPSVSDMQAIKPTLAPPARSHDLLQALTSALEILGTARDPTAALTESFQHASRAFGAEKALLLRVRATDPLELESIRASGLEFEQVKACLSGQPVEGVSSSRIRRAVATGALQLVENSQFEGANAGQTGSLRGRPHSVLCAPVTDPWTKAPLAVLYFQTRPGPGGYTPEDVPFLQGYATTLGHAFGLFLTSEQRYRELEEEWKRLQRDRPDHAPELIGDSEEIARLREELHETYLPATAAHQPRPILLLGETGTGKDLVARYLHYYSPARGRAPFVEYNCAGLSGELVQTTLFGHVRGAFTGATETAQGLFRSADKGTLFLDEIGELPPQGQELLLKVLDHWTVRPVGDTRSYEVNVQLLCATNRDLAAVVREGRFRHDLYQRLKALTIRLTPLAQRPGDIRPLLAHFLAQAEKGLQKRTRGLTPAALRALLAYAWPGNIRELAGVSWALVTHCRAGAEIEVEDVRRHCPDVLSQPRRDRVRFAEEEVTGSFRDARSRFERDFLVHRVELHRWNVPEAARSMGLSAATLYRYLQRHGLRQGDERTT